MREAIGCLCIFPQVVSMVPDTNSPFPSLLFHFEMVCPDKKLTPFQRSISLLKAKANKTPTSSTTGTTGAATGAATGARTINPHPSPSQPATGPIAVTPLLSSKNTAVQEVKAPVPVVAPTKKSQAPLPPSVVVAITSSSSSLSPSSSPSSSAYSPPSSPSSSTAPSSAPSTPPPPSSSLSSSNSSSPSSTTSSLSSSPSSPSHTRLETSLSDQSVSAPTTTTTMPSNSTTLPVTQNHILANTTSAKQQQQTTAVDQANDKATNGTTMTKAIPSTFITLASQVQEPGTDDSDDDPIPDAASGGSGRKRTVTTGGPLTGPYLATSTVGQRSLSTPNLHADNSLIISPANSPPGSPGMPAIASVTDSTHVPALTLDGNSSNITLNDAVVLTLSPSASPMASPNSSPRLAPRKSVGSVSGVAPPVGRTKNGERPSNRLSGAPQPSLASTLKQKAPPASDGTKTLKSSKNKTINRTSVVSLFDTGASSMTLPTNFARKGSLPQDAAHNGGTGGLAGLFVAQPQDLTSTPFSLTLAEFRLNDIYPKRQRRLLTVLHRMDNRLRKEGVVKKLTKEQLKGKPGS